VEYAVSGLPPKELVDLSQRLLLAAGDD